MIRKLVFSILCAFIVWVLGVSFYLLSYFVPVLENPELQSNITLALGILPSAYLGTYLFYKKSFIKPSALALIFILTATLLDMLVTVPVFIIPNEGSYSSFFGNPMFYVILLEFYFIVLFFGKRLSNKRAA